MVIPENCPLHDKKTFIFITWHIVANIILRAILLELFGCSIKKMCVADQEKLIPFTNIYDPCRLNPNHFPVGV